MLKSRMKVRISSIAIIILSITLVYWSAQLIYEVKSYDYDTTTDVYTLSYCIQNKDYAQLVKLMYQNETEELEADEELQEYYAVARYFEAASMYKAYVDAGEKEKANQKLLIMNEQEKLTGELQFVIENINEKLKID